MNCIISFLLGILLVNLIPYLILGHHDSLGILKVYLRKSKRFKFLMIGETNNGHIYLDNLEKEIL